MTARVECFLSDLGSCSGRGCCPSEDLEELFRGSQMSTVAGMKSLSKRDMESASHCPFTGRVSRRCRISTILKKGIMPNLISCTHASCLTVLDNTAMGGSFAQ
eukprot:scaffold20791_cov26-Tisochrysis_lutea.AAC.2